MKLKGYSILNNIYFLYFVFFVALINLFGFMYNKDYQSVFLFACFALIIYLFNNNMIIVLLSTLIFVNLLIVLNTLNGNTTEGLENEMPKNETEKNKTDENDLKNKEVSKLDEYTNTIKTLGTIVKGINLNDTKEKMISEDNTESNNLKEKINKVCDNSDMIYTKINELNSKINELTQIIQ
jgi:hypothetical protein